MTRITVVIPKAHTAAVRDGLRNSQLAVAEEVESLRCESQRSRALTRTVGRLEELSSLLDQLSDSPSTGRAVTGEYEPLRTAACDALVSAIERLAAVAHSHWRYNASLGRVERRLEAVTECAAMLRDFQAAKVAATAHR